MLAGSLALTYAWGMMLRALILLVFAIGLSVTATVYFGQDVLIALGLILVQTKILLKKLVGLEIPVLLVWFKTQAAAFFKIELIKKWLMTTAMPLLLGRAVLRRVAALFGGYIDAVRARYTALMAWYNGLSFIEKTLSALTLLFALLALSVSSLGLWLILFSVQLPLWIVAAMGTLGRLIWSTIQKSGFKAVAFLQLSWLWRGIKYLLPSAVMKRKRSFDYRVARAVIRRRRITVRQLAERKESFPFRMGILFEYLFGSGAGRVDDANPGKDA